MKGRATLICLYLGFSGGQLGGLRLTLNIGKTVKTPRVKVPKEDQKRVKYQQPPQVPFQEPINTILQSPQGLF